jgi:hypothetical protein
MTLESAGSYMALDVWAKFAVYSNRVLICLARSIMIVHIAFNKVSYLRQVFKTLKKATY